MCLVQWTICVFIVLSARARALQNVVINSDFDSFDLSTSWTLTPPADAVITDHGRDGNAAILSCQPPVQCRLSQVINTDATKAYNLTFWLRQTGPRTATSIANFAAFLGPVTQDKSSQQFGQVLHIDPASLSQDWTQFYLEAAGHGPATLLAFMGSGANDAFAIDDIAVTTLGPVQLILASASASAGHGGVSSSSSAGGASAGSSKGSGSGLSPGATAGTVVGVVVAVIGFGTALFEWLKSRNQTKLAGIATGQVDHARPSSRWIPWRKA